MSIPTKLIGGVGVFALAGLLMAMPATADVGISGNIFSLEICREIEGVPQCVAIFDVPSEGTWNGTTWSWELPDTLEIYNFSHSELVATLSEGTRVEITPPVEGSRSDPVVNLGFAMQAGNALTTFTVKSALLNGLSISNPQGRASATFTVSDGLDDDGGLLTGLNAGGGSYLAQYNGHVPSGTNFAELIPSMVIPVEGSFGTTEDYPGGGLYSAIAGTVSNMSSEISFTVTPNDLASGTSVFEIVPEPSALLLLAAGLTLWRRR